MIGEALLLREEENERMRELEEQRDDALDRVRELEAATPLSRAMTVCRAHGRHVMGDGELAEIDAEAKRAEECVAVMRASRDHARFMAAGWRRLAMRDLAMFTAVREDLAEFTGGDDADSVDLVSRVRQMREELTSWSLSSAAHNGMTSEGWEVLGRLLEEAAMYEQTCGASWPSWDDAVRRWIDAGRPGLPSDEEGE